MSAPVPVTARRSSQASIPGSSGCRSSSCDDPRPRRLSLADVSAAWSSRKLSLVQCSTSSDSIEIDTSSVSYDLPAVGVSCAGSYQPIPSDAAIRHSPVLHTHITANRPIWRALILGQLMSLMLCVMAACNHYLSTQYQVNLPAGQNTMHYVLQCLLFTTWLSSRPGDQGIVHVFRCRGWRYLLLALLDVEASYLFARAHQFTTLTSIQLLDCVAIPAVLALTCLLLKVHYKLVHILGVSICLMGVGCLVWADIDDGRTLTGGRNQLLGDMLCLGGALLFAVVSVAQDLVVKTLDWVEYLGMVGLFGSILSTVQTAVLERDTILLMPWDTWQVVALLLGFGLAQFLFCISAPAMLHDSGATALQLSLLTADFYWIMLSIILLHYKLHALYFVSFALTATGIVVYAVKRTPILSHSQQATTYRAMSRDNTTADNVELATPISDLVSLSACPSQQLDDSTYTQLSAGCPDNQVFRTNGDAPFC
ncbi:Solute carrier family 35 member F1 [Zootermopsis nevadensis]|uniref:Solute carrier family 35 member F1 n=2 Tax=Zootermopsis nevadensis TaxID=136037 RepID=A0A067QXW1_ZOONE|nr:Solute carrier family 35 member F1 [Zootermopsis nevadensis]